MNLRSFVANKNYQRFKPLESTPGVTSSPDKQDGGSSRASPSFLGQRADPVFVPRQRFLLVHVHDKEVRSGIQTCDSRPQMVL